MKTYYTNYHSFVDVITNSSSELFVSTDQKIIEFFKEIINEDLGNKYSYLKLMSFKDFYKDHYLDEYEEDNPEAYKKEYGHLKDEDDILVCNVSSEDYTDLLDDLMRKFNFKSMY